MLKKSFIIDQFNEIEIKKNSNKKINQVLPFFSLVTRIFVLTILEKKKIFFFTYQIIHYFLKG